MRSSDYDSRTFWEERLRRNWNLIGVGHMAYSQRYNSYLYCAKVRTLLRAIKDYQVQIENSEVLDVGSGTVFGFNGTYKQAHLT